ncbi:hypothetical protein L1049_006894 [Liquidambar formosana]|uniref:Uncharacterized protein n=1 Tax=Liquidambar formosana TaxID=63359 RepID=A0AAP0RHR0_LIQFO
MEVPIINRISGFEAGMSSLHNPSFLYRLSASLSELENMAQAYSFWKWGALIIAMIATFGSVIGRIKVLIIKYRKGKSPLSEPLLIHLEDEDYSDEEDESSLSCSSEDEGEDSATSPAESPQPVDEDFRVAGRGEFDWQNRKSKLRRRRCFGERFSWSEFANGRSVVKLWDGLGLGLDLNGSAGNIISIYDLNQDQKITSFFGGKCQSPSVTVASPAVVLSDNSTNVSLRVWDPRVGRQNPAIFADWRPQRGRIVGMSPGGLERVYVRDDITGELMVGDVRKINSLSKNVTESEGDTWWDADAVMVSDECLDESDVNGCDSVVSRCRDAVRSVLF